MIRCKDASASFSLQSNNKTEQVLIRQERSDIILVPIQKVGGKTMSLTEAQRRANDKYIAQNYKQVKLSMPKEEAEELEKFCKEKGYTKAGFIREAIKEKMERE